MHSNDDVTCWGRTNNQRLGAEFNSNQVRINRIDAPLANPQGLTMGTRHTCIWSSTRIECWGNNSRRQLGSGPSDNNVSNPQRIQGLPEGTVEHVAAAFDHTCAVIDEAGTDRVFCWGSNIEFGLGNPQVNEGDNSANPVETFAPQSPVAALVARHYTTCAWLENATLFCWGGPSKLNARAPKLETLAQPTRITPAELIPPVVETVALGNNHLCVQSDSGQVWCWGASTAGQVGLGMPGLGEVTEVGPICEL